MKRVSLMMTIAVLYVSGMLWCQCPGSLLLSSQIEVDNFEANYGQCDTIPWLIISGDDIQNLEGLSGFRGLYGNLSINNNPMLSGLAGLDSLEFVKGSVYIYFNNALNNLEGLSSLKSVSNLFIVSDNDQMVNIAGLDSLASVSVFALGNLGITSFDGMEHLARSGNAFHLMIEECAYLKSLAGLDTLRHLNQLSISDCDSLMTLDGLQQLERATFITLYQNQALADISALGNVNFSDLMIRRIPRLQTLPALDGIDILSSLLLFENDSLRNVDGLSHVTEIGVIQIDSNFLLEDILGLSQVEFTSNSISIRENPHLDMCQVPFLCNYAQQVTDVNAFHGNGASCASAPAIIAGCQFEGGSGSGLLYLDMNCDQQFDSADFVLPHYVLVRTDNGIPVASSDAEGFYQRYLFLEDTITFQPRDLEHFVWHPASYTLMTGVDPVFYDSLDFGFCPDSIFHAVRVSATLYTNFARGFNAGIWVCAHNDGSFIENATLQLDFENFPNEAFIEIIHAEGGGQIIGKIVEWDLQDIIPFQTRCFQVTIRIDPAIDLGSIITAEARIIPETMSEEDPIDNIVLLTEEVVGSFDPNDKKVDLDHIPVSEEAMPLQYTIQFQNTGTFPASFVEVRDTIPGELDMRSVEMIAASHEYTLSFPDPRVLHWRFDPIFLPDSTTNEAGSHGFVQYRIHALPEIAPGVEIRNSASIYFDFNEPVHTGDAVTLVESPTSANTSPHAPLMMTISPNPAQDDIAVSYLVDQPSSCQFRLVGINGMVFDSGLYFAETPGVQTQVLSLRNLPNGIYMLQVITKQGVSVGKVVVSSNE